MTCKLIGFLGLALQAVVAAAFGAVLLAKYFIERTQSETPRSLFVFAMDCSKQVVGAAWIHLLNLVFAGVLATVSTRGDACVWFWLNLMLDTTLGVLTEFIVLQGINTLIRNICSYCKTPHHANDWVESGDYFSKDGVFKPQRYFKQLLIWVVVIVSLMKASMVGLMLIFNTHLEGLAEFVLHPVMHNERAKLVVVTIITPGIMNAFQFWVVDNIIHRQPSERELIRQRLKELDGMYKELVGEPSTHFQTHGGTSVNLHDLQDGLASITNMVMVHDRKLQKMPSEDLNRQVNEIREFLLPELSEKLPTIEAKLDNFDKQVKCVIQDVGDIQAKLGSSVVGSRVR